MRVLRKMSLLGAVIASIALMATAETGIGSEAPEFELTSLDGEVVSLEQLRDQIVVIHFATSW